MPAGDVRLLRWPDDARDGAALAASGTAVLYLVNDDARAPIVTNCLEDWIRVPGEEDDLLARVAALETRGRLHLAPPRLDADGLLHYQGGLVLLPPEHRPAVRALVERFGDVVPDRELTIVPEQRRAVIAQIRAQVRAVGLTLRRVRRRGYRLEGR